MTNIMINNKNHTLVITKGFEKKARAYGSAECEELLKAQKDFPNYRIVIRKTTSKNDTFAGLTYNFMEGYIKSHKDAETNLNAFNTLRARTNETEGSNVASASFKTIKDWFLKTYPEIGQIDERRNEILAA